MPIYTFFCLKCKKEFDELTMYDDTGKYKDVRCPVCKSKKKRKLINSCGEIVFKDPRGTSKADKFTYVAGYNLEQAKEERRKAEEASHMGQSPYPEFKDQ